ncbi:hypothetical protein [Pullulanibacillus camelliae]|uniref:hypothetical protein n=1 Tax=Pullulanibacillus camelliae TaxID=1707096 RepID=UPI00166C5FE5|nr:hypothetical protein [Pullulanibacillus camelliae]
MYLAFVALNWIWKFTLRIRSLFVNSELYLLLCSWFLLKWPGLLFLCSWFLLTYSWLLLRSLLDSEAYPSVLFSIWKFRVLFVILAEAFVKMPTPFVTLQLAFVNLLLAFVALTSGFGGLPLGFILHLFLAPPALIR